MLAEHDELVCGIGLKVHLPTALEARLELTLARGDHEHPNVRLTGSGLGIIVVS